MRIWSLHPSYLDTKGLVALWRETLLAKNVLENKTKGYKNHPQLLRFKNLAEPLSTINSYLSHVYYEALERRYNFNKEKIDWEFNEIKLTVNYGQIKYEFEHLKRKLLVRDNKKFAKISIVKEIMPHPIFQIVDGEIEDWEVIY